jgi:hypothetical protein
MKTKDKEKKKDSKERAKKKKTKEQTKEELERAKKWEDVWFPALIIGVIVIIMGVIIFVSFKSQDESEGKEKLKKCALQLRSRVGPVVASYNKEKKIFPESLTTLHEWIAAPSQGHEDEKRADIDKRVFDIWRNFYCPADPDQQTFSYLYTKPEATSPDDFIVLKCRIHGEKSILRLRDLKDMEGMK